MSKRGEQPIKQSSGKSRTVHTAPASHTHARLMPDRVWLVLARRTYDEPLRQIGTVEADDSDLAGVYATSIYDEFAWIEMAVIPREALVTVIHA
ncbi:MAG: hypothetical protein ABI068_11865 [Ktedonobacterales bacterium]